MEGQEQPSGLKIEGSLLSDEFAQNGNDAPAVVNDTPPVNNEAPPTNDAPPANDTPAVIPFETKWKETFGDATPETVKEKFSQFDTIHTEYEQLKTRPTYRTDAGKQIDEWLDKGVKLETIAKFSSVKPEELTDDQAIKLRAEIENPKWEAKHIEADFRSKYTHTADELVADEINQTHADLKEGAKLRDAAAAKAFLADYLNKQLNPSGELEAVKQKQAEAKSALSQGWVNNSSVLQSSVKEVKDELVFKVPTEKGEEEVKLPYSYAVPENDLKQLTDFAIQTAVNQGIQPTQEGAKQVTEYLQGLIWAKFGKNIVQAALTDAMSKQQAAFARIINNPVPTGGGGTVTPSNMTREEAFLQNEVKRSGR